MSQVKTKKQGEPVKQISVMLQNRVGSLDSLLRLIETSGEDVIGLSMQDSKDATIVRIIVTDPSLVVQLFLEKGIPHTTCRMVVVAMRDPSSEMIKCMDILKAGETNVDFAYSLISHPEGRSLLALHLDDYDFGAEMLRCAGVKVLYQCDLSR